MHGTRNWIAPSRSRCGPRRSLLIRIASRGFGEAKTLASLNHLNLAHIHGLEGSAGIRALVMELVEGEDLAQRLARGAIPDAEALAIAKQMPPT